MVKTLRKFITLCICSYYKTFVRPHFSVPPSNVRFLLPRSSLLIQHSATRIIIPSYLMVSFGEGLNGFLMGRNTGSISSVWWPGNSVRGELEVYEILLITSRIDRLPILRSAPCSRWKWLIFMRALPWEWLLWRDCGENIDGRGLRSVDLYERNKYKTL